MTIETPEKGKPRKRLYCTLADIQLVSEGIYSFVNLPEDALGNYSEIVVIDSPGMLLFYNVEDELLYVWNTAEDAVNSSVIAPLFSPEVNYNKGDIVYNNSKLYIALSDISAGEWSSSDWELVTVGGLLEGKQEAITLETISFPLSWSGSEPYTQTLSGTYAVNAEISLRPTVAQIAQLISDGVTALTVENNNGTLTAYTLGAAPTVAMDIVCDIVEVS